MNKKELNKKIEELQKEVKEKYCNVDKCNNHSKYLKTKIVNDCNISFLEKHYVCEKHKYHLSSVVKCISKYFLHSDWDEVKKLKGSKND